MSVLESTNLGAVVKLRVEAGATHSRISRELKIIFPNLKGVSPRSIRRYCEKNDIHRTSRLLASSLDTLLLWSIGKVCYYQSIGDKACSKFLLGWPKLWKKNDERFLKITRI